MDQRRLPPGLRRPDDGPWAPPPSMGTAVRRLPPWVRRFESDTHRTPEFHDRSIGTAARRSRRAASSPPFLGGGRGSPARASPPGQRPGLFDNSVVGRYTNPVRGRAEGPFGARTSIAARDSFDTSLPGSGGEGAFGPRSRREAGGAGGILHTQFHAAATRVAAVSEFENEPFGLEEADGPDPASRDAGPSTRAGRGEESSGVRIGRDRLSARVLPRTRGPDRRGQAPKGAGGMPRRRQGIGRGRLR